MPWANRKRAADAALDHQAHGYARSRVDLRIGGADGECVGVVFCEHWNVHRQCCQGQFVQVDVSPTKDGGDRCVPVAIHLSRRRQTESFAEAQLVRGYVAKRLLNGTPDRRFDRNRTPVERLDRAAHDVRGKIDFDGRDVFDADFNAEKKSRLRGQLEEDSGAPRSRMPGLFRGVLLNLPHESRSRQLSDNVAGRRPVQSHCPGKLGTTEAPNSMQRLKGRDRIVLAYSAW